MRRIAIAFVLLVFPSFASAETLNFEWKANTESDLAGYELHWGSVEGKYENVVDIPLAGLPTPPKFSLVQPDALCGEDKTKFFALLAYDTVGNKSEPSNIVPKTSNPAPCPPEMFKQLVKSTVIELMKDAKIETTIRFSVPID